ncbi:hypothetical protein ACFVS2_25250 [Brevibacillus sp. NPDC058079]|uniref:hypothetical protein n=1 Tax=Brevibacillus sp. NPDC058079 TaxID=3346330 RepID=UPI0036E876CE
MIKYYHVTRKENKESILKHGLIAQRGANVEWMYDKKGVYLFTSLENMREALGGWLHLLFCDDWDIISFEVELPPDFELHRTNNEWEMRSNIDIPAEYIRYFSEEKLYDAINLT